MDSPVEKCAYRGWPNCVRVANAEIELLVTLDVGPRIIRFGFVGGANEFYEHEEDIGQSGGERWRMYGGHRLWRAPEDPSLTYAPDNAPVALEKCAGGIRLIAPLEARTGIQKEIELRLSASGTQVQVLHRLHNRSSSELELAPWALSVMAPGGTAVLPFPPRGEHPKDLLPSSTLTLWPYTDLSDPRWNGGALYLLLSQDPASPRPQKIGALVPDGWTAYANRGHLFVKRTVCVPGARYPDFGCNVELFTNKQMLEVETLGPLTRLAPGACVEHTERWLLFRDVPDLLSDAVVERQVKPKLAGG